MNQAPQKLTIDQWDHHYRHLNSADLKKPFYGGNLSRHLEKGDYILNRLEFDNSPESLNLWNFLLTEDERLTSHRNNGKKLIGTMKDLGTTAALACAFSNAVPFYPDGAWWIPCVMNNSDGLLKIADSLGIDESFCPVRAMLGAFVSKAHFPIPDLLVCSAGAVCDDFSAISQYLNSLGFPIHYWQIPARRHPSQNEAILTYKGLTLAQAQLELVKSELISVKHLFEDLCQIRLMDEMLSNCIRETNQFRQLLSELRNKTFTAQLAPLPALEMLISEMLAIHFCSDQYQATAVIQDLLAMVELRVAENAGYGSKDDVKIFWLNPVADLQVMNILETCGCRLCGTDFMFTHALDQIPVDIDPLTALAVMALSDPMVGSSEQRAMRICHDMKLYGAQALIISRIPGASHCAVEGLIVADYVRKEMDVPVIEIEVAPLSQSYLPSVINRIEALVESVRNRRLK